MLNFRQITLADRPWIQTALRQSDFMGCEYRFANNLAWCRGADSRICALEGFYLIRRTARRIFRFPAERAT